MSKLNKFLFFLITIPCIWVLSYVIYLIHQPKKSIIENFEIDKSLVKEMNGLIKNQIYLTNDKTQSLELRERNIEENQNLMNSYKVVVKTMILNYKNQINYVLLNYSAFIAWVWFSLIILLIGIYVSIKLNSSLFLIPWLVFTTWVSFLVYKGYYSESLDNIVSTQIQEQVQSCSEIDSYVENNECQETINSLVTFQWKRGWLSKKIEKWVYPFYFYKDNDIQKIEDPIIETIDNVLKKNLETKNK